RPAGGPARTPAERAGEKGTVMRALVITVSNRVSAGIYADKSGPLLATLLAKAGCDVVDGPRVVPDGEPVEAALREGVAQGYDVIVTTGGTGVTPQDLTPEMTRRVSAREVPGSAEAVRVANRERVPTSILSRGIAGQAGSTLIGNPPGSSGGVRDGMAVLAPVLAHVVDQMRGGDHPRTG